MIERLEALLAGGQDNALLRFSLGRQYASAGDPARAVGHLRAALAHDPDYSAAWVALGQALAETGAIDEALRTYRQGIEVAERRGDLQAARQMRVFARRLQRG